MKAAHRGQFALRSCADPGGRRGSRSSPSAPGSPASRARCGSSSASRRSRARLRSSATGTAARESATRCRPFSRCRASPAYARGAVVLVISDGLERGDPTAHADAVAKLSRRAWRLSWLTPLARRPRLPPAHRGADGGLAASSTIWCDGGSTPAIVDAYSGARRGGRHDRDRRRASSHLATGRPAVARWGRCSRGFLAPTSRSGATIRSRNIRADIAGAGVTQIGLCADELGARRLRATRRHGCSGRATKTGWPHALVGYADFSADDVRPQLDRLSRYPARCAAPRMQLHWHENPHIPLRGARRISAADPTIQRNVGRLADYGWSSIFRCSRRRWPSAATLARGLSERHLRAAARRHA